MSEIDDGQGDEDKVGYKRPPRKNWFKKGQSGNPKGRPKGRTSFKTDFEAAIFQKVDVMIGGRRVRMNKQQLLVHQLINKALAGDPKAEVLVMKLLPEIASKEADPSPAHRENLQTIAQNFLLRQRAAAAAAAAAEAPDAESGVQKVPPEGEGEG